MEKEEKEIILEIQKRTDAVIQAAQASKRIEVDSEKPGDDSEEELIPKGGYTLNFSTQKKIICF